MLVLLLAAACSGDDDGESVDTSEGVSASEAFDDAAGGGPTVTDHWHVAYAVDICGELTPQLSSGASDPNGIHTHDDGVVHVHPGAAQVVPAEGEEATVAVFLEATGAILTDDSLSLELEGEPVATYTEGEEGCDGEPAVVQVAYWPDAEGAGSEDPIIVTEDVDDVVFRDDRAAVTVAFLPEGETPRAPTTVGVLADLSGESGSAVTTPPTTIVP